MLVYHPAFDAHHCILRMLRLIHAHGEESLEVEQLRILDFYYLFPHLLAKVQVLSGQVAKKNKFGRRANKFNRVPSPPMLMMRMQPIQTAALQTMAAHSLIDQEELARNFVLPIEQQPRASLERILKEQTEGDAELIEYLATQIAKIPLHGPSGLKKRTGLLEYRYDEA